MPRTRLDVGLQDLRAQMMYLGLQVQNNLASVLKALETGNRAPLRSIVEAGSRIDTLCGEVEREALHLLILQQPLGGLDLRLLTASLHISSDLGKIGDAVTEVAEALLKAATLYHQVPRAVVYSADASTLDPGGHPTDAFILRGLLLLGGEIVYILRQSMMAFEQRDVEIAYSVKGEHDLVEIRYVPLCQDILDIQAQQVTLSNSERDPTFVQRVTYLFWMAHKLAEMATCISSICRRVIFIVEGTLPVA